MEKKENIKEVEGRKNFGNKRALVTTPQPCVMIATWDKDHNPDVMMAAWAGQLDYTQIVISLGKHKTTDNLELTGAFTISFADERTVAESDYFGIVSGNDVPDKVAKAGFTFTPSPNVDAPIINEYPLTLECKVVSFKDGMLIGEIVNQSADESILTNGKIDLEKLKPIVFDAAGMCYRALGGNVGKAWGAGREIQKKGTSTVFLTREISPESLVRIYKALGVEAKGRVAVKMSTGEGSNPNYLKPELIKNLVKEVDGTIVECNTAYGNAPEDQQDDRNTSANHWKVIERHGFTPTFKVDLMDEEGEMHIPVKDTTYIKYDIVGTHMANYDFMIALNHFKGHPMGGYGGALKNLSIGCASQNGKAYIHSSGKMEKLDMEKLWTPEYVGNQDGFLECMATAAQAVVNYFQKKEGIIYISVMNNMSIDCDCVDHPEPVKLEDYGILASTDPVALDQACIDIINQQKVTAKNDPTDLLNRIDQQHGVHTIEHAAKIGLGSRQYKLVSIDK